MYINNGHLVNLHLIVLLLSTALGHLFVRRLILHLSLNVSWCFMFDLASKVVSTHLLNTTGYNGIPFIVGQGDCLGCTLRVCCKFLDLLEAFLN